MVVSASPTPGPESIGVSGQGISHLVRETLDGHSSGVLAVAFAADGDRVVTGGDLPDSTARTWRVETGEALKILQGHTDAVLTADFSSDGAQILTGGMDRTARIWNGGTGGPLHLYDHPRSVVAAVFSPDGSQMLTGGGLLDNVARLWQVEGQQVAQIFTGHALSITAVAFSPDGKRVLTGSRDGTAKLWDVTSGDVIRSFSGHGAEVLAAVFSPDGSRVLTGGLDTTALLWETETGVLLRAFQGHLDGVTSVAYCPSGSRVFTASRDRSAKMWDKETGQLVLEFSGHTAGLTSVAVSPDGTLVLTGSHDGTAKLWTIRLDSPTLYADWAETIGGGATAGPGEYLPGDQVPHLIKYALGFAPNKPSPEQHFQVIPIPAGPTEVYFHRHAWRGDVIFQVEGSSDLMTWTPLARADGSVPVQPLEHDSWEIKGQDTSAMDHRVRLMIPKTSPGEEEPPTFFRLTARLVD